ncbi:MAG: hypothetical protein NUV72_11195, partial [Bauldia sp.]|nr:hypothetical protein [Bauldia sp.]
MTESVLWKRLTETDFNAMNAEASPHGAGGGARHIALGVRTKSFPIDDFLGTPGGTHATITAQSAKAALEPLDFYSNPERRGGEWTIRNQYSHRHPAWSNSEGFPTHFDPTNPPYILVFSAADAYFARFANELDLDALWA